MKKLKFYILTSSDLESLKVHNSEEWTEIPKKDTVIVINTLDKEYEQKAKQYCQEEGIEHYITESNGRPGKGKNSVFDLFLKSDNDYCVLIDGDDLITPHGLWLYKQIAKLKSPPDAIGLKKQVSIRYIDDVLYHLNPFTVNFKELLKIDWRKEFYKDSRLSKTKAHRFGDYYRRYYQQQQKYSEPNEIHSRVVWFSKKAAQFKFNENIKIGEDTLQMLVLKHEALTNNLKFLINVEDPCTYIYDERSNGIVLKTTENGKNHNWMGVYLKELKKLESKKMLHKYKALPELQISYPKNYIPEDYGIGTAN